MKATILGSGFGMYGYLPALVAAGARAVLPLRYRTVLENRPELAPYVPDVEWVTDDSPTTALAASKLAVIALPPAAQPAQARLCLAQPNLTHLLLEKPLAIDPATAQSLLAQLRTSGKTFRIGYNFRYTTWGKALLQGSTSPTTINWSFRAHHYQTDTETWKRHHTQGGGALRFYGIHLIALLAEVGYTTCTTSQINATKPTEAETWSATYTGPNLPACTVHVATNAPATNFSLNSGSTSLLNLTQPFESPAPASNGDQRVPYLQTLLTELLTSQGTCPWYESALTLWQATETITAYTYCQTLPTSL